MLYFYLKNLIESVLRQEEGQDLTEYALLLVLIVVAAVGAVTLLGTNIVGVMNSAAGSL